MIPERGWKNAVTRSNSGSGSAEKIGERGDLAPVNGHIEGESADHLPGGALVANPSEPVRIGNKHPHLGLGTRQAQQGQEHTENDLHTAASNPATRRQEPKEGFGNVMGQLKTGTKHAILRIKRSGE